MNVFYEPLKLFTSDESNSNAVDVYNVATRTWSTAQLSVARRLLSAALIGNLAIFAGGHSGRTFMNQCRGLLAAANV
jgi:hypothetical protein